MKSLFTRALAAGLWATAFCVSTTAAWADPAPSVPAAAATSLANSRNPFALVETNSPEYLALQRLASDGLVIQHANLLKDKHALTRYEAAVIAAEAINNAKAYMRDGKNAQLNADDVAALRIVYDDVKDDLTALTARVSADERRIAALEANRSPQRDQDQPSNQINPSPSPTPFVPSFEIHGEFRIRPVNSFSTVASATTAQGVPVPNGVPLIRTGMSGDAFVTTGSVGGGQFQSRVRLVSDGHVSPNANFIIRLATEDFGGANNVSFLHNDFSFIQYAIPHSGFSFYGGKLLYCCDTPWLPDGTGMIADAVPIGVALKWSQPSDSAHKISAWASVGSLKNAETLPVPPPTCPTLPVGLTQNIFAAHAEGVVFPTTKLQGQWVTENSQCFTAVPTGGPLLNELASIQTGSLTLNQSIGPLLSITLEALGRFGTDPTTRKSWIDNGAYWVGVNYGRFGLPYHVAFDTTYINSGKNSVASNLDSTINGVDSPWNFLLPFPTNVQTFDIGANWFFGQDALMRLEWATANLRDREAATNGDIITGFHQNYLIFTGRFTF
jgi:hypothetical protein